MQKERNSKYFGKYPIIDNLDNNSKEKLKKYYEELKTMLVDKEKTKQFASYIKRLLIKNN